MLVLIADDNRDAANATAQVISLSLDCQTQVAYGGLQALEAIGRHKPDALIVDLQMPDLEGVEVARLVRERYPGAAPYLVAVTGWPSAARHLSLLDSLFDRVFAKPLDVDEIVAALARRKQLRERAPVPLDAGDMFTRAARRLMPIVAARGLGLAFDHRGPPLVVVDDPVELQSCFHRLLHGLVDIMQSGFVIFGARTTPDPDSGSWLFTLDAAGSGPLRMATDVDAVIARLAFTEATADALRGARHHRSGTGTCPNTGAAVTFSIDAAEGVLLRAVLRYPGAQPQPERTMPATGQWHAWLVDGEDVPHTWLLPQLRRLGWHTLGLRGSAKALARLRAARDVAQPQALPVPSLLVVMERALCSAASLAEMRQALPPQMQMVLAVVAGSPILGGAVMPAGVDVRVYPFSPTDIADLCEMALPPDARLGAASEASWPQQIRTRPGSRYAALDGDEQPDVLLVDDNEINRMLGKALLEALGCVVRTAHDGLDAIDRCRQAPPQLVLMDLDMPVLGGLHATARLRDLQRTGEIAPFPIVAATANDGGESVATCQRVGMDGFLAKPLQMAELSVQLRRFLLGGVTGRSK